MGQLLMRIYYLQKRCVLVGAGPVPTDILPRIQKAIVYLIGLSWFCMTGYEFQIASHGYYRIVNQLRWQLCMPSERSNWNGPTGRTISSISANIRCKRKTETKHHSGASTENFMDYSNEFHPAYYYCHVINNCHCYNMFYDVIPTGLVSLGLDS